MNFRHYLLQIAGMLCCWSAVAQEFQDHQIAQPGAGRFDLTGWNDLTFNSTDVGFPKLFTDSSAHEAGIRGGSEISSNSLSLAFSVSALSNNYLDEDLKNSVSDQLSGKNVFEYHAGAEIFFRFIAENFIGRSPALLSFGFRAGSFQQLGFTDDLFHVAFYGNAGYAGRTADFSGSEGLLYDYRQVRFGIQKKVSKASAVWEAGLGASILFAKNGSQVKVNEGTLFTEQNGEYLHAVYDFEYMVSDTGNKGTLQADGIGAAADVMLAWLSADRNSRMVLFVNDLGFIGWNNRTDLYRADSAIYFEGIEATDFLTGEDDALFQFNTDSILVRTGTSSERGALTTFLPFSLSLNYSNAFADRWMAGGGISYRPSVDLMPFFYAQPVYSFSRWFDGGVTLSYGGTAGFQLGILGQFSWGNQLQIRLASENIMGILLPYQSTSTSLFLQASVQF